jgi:hypothetical protein
MACRHLLQEDVCDTVSGIFPFPFASVRERADRDGTLLVDCVVVDALLGGVLLPFLAGRAAPDEGAVAAAVGCIAGAVPYAKFVCRIVNTSVQEPWTRVRAIVNTHLVRCSRDL